MMPAGTVAVLGTVSFLYMSGFPAMEHEVGITHLRDTLGIAVQHVAHTGDPIIVRRYTRADVVLVPLWEWRWLKGIETAIQSGEIDASEFLAGLDESGGTWLDAGARPR